MSMTAFRLHIIACAAVLCGCTASLQPHSPISQTPNGVLEVQCYSFANIVGGQVTLAPSREKAGKFSIRASSNTVMWNGTELVLLKRDIFSFRFFDPKAKRRISVSPPDATDRDDEAMVQIEIPFGISPFNATQLTTERKTGRSVQAELEKLEFVPGRFALIAESKYVDGTLISGRNIELVGTIDKLDHICALNSAPANIEWIELATGGRGLRISNVVQELILWPDGSWLTFVSADPGIAFGGGDKSFESLYLSLRALAKRTVDEKEAEIIRKRVPARAQRQTI